MARNGVDGIYLDHLVQRQTTPFDLVYADIGEIGTATPLRVSNGPKYFTVSGSSDAELNGTFIPQGSLLNMGSIEEDANFQIGELQVTLSGVNGAAIALLLGNPYLDRTVKVWRGLLDVNYEIVDEPVLIFQGNISGANIEDNPADGTSTVSVVVSSQWVDFERKNGKKSNDAEQQIRFPGDQGLEFAAESIRNIAWGRD